MPELIEFAHTASAAATIAAAVPRREEILVVVRSIDQGLILLDELAGQLPEARLIRSRRILDTPTARIRVANPTTPLHGTYPTKAFVDAILLTPTLEGKLRRLLAKREALEDGRG